MVTHLKGKRFKSIKYKPKLRKNRSPRIKIMKVKSYSLLFKLSFFQAPLVLTLIFSYQASIPKNRFQFNGHFYKDGLNRYELRTCLGDGPWANSMEDWDPNGDE